MTFYILQYTCSKIYISYIYIYFIFIFVQKKKKYANKKFHKKFISLVIPTTQLSISLIFAFYWYISLFDIFFLIFSLIFYKMLLLSWKKINENFILTKYFNKICNFSLGYFWCLQRKFNLIEFIILKNFIIFWWKEKKTEYLLRI